MKGTKRCGRAERYCVSSRAWLFCVTSPGSSNQVRKCKSNRLGVGQISHIRSSQLLAFVPVGSAASLEATKSTSKTLKRAGPISAVSLPLIWLPNSESSLNESCLYSDSYGRVGSEFPALPIFRSRDENPNDYILDLGRNFCHNSEHGRINRASIPDRRRNNKP